MYKLPQIFCSELQSASCCLFSKRTFGEMCFRILLVPLIEQNATLFLLSLITTAVIPLSLAVVLSKLLKSSFKSSRNLDFNQKLFLIMAHATRVKSFVISFRPGINHCRSNLYFPPSNELFERFFSTFKSHI